MLETKTSAQEAVLVSRFSDPAIPNEPFGFVRGLPNHDYHHGPGLSHSGVKLLRKSPWHYHAQHHLQLPAWMLDDVDAEGNAALFAGTLCHAATLEPEAFDDRYLIGPAINKNTKEWKAFVEQAKPKQVISERQHAIAHAQAAALRAIPDVAEILDGGEFEVSGYWRDPVTGVLCRCRPDCLNLRFGTHALPASMLLDVKTTQDASTTAAVRNTIGRYGYHLQADWYSRGIEAITGAPVLGFVFAFVESAYPFAGRVVELDPWSMEQARRENDEALRLYAYCEQMGIWPGYPQDLAMVSLPRWAGGE